MTPADNAEALANRLHLLDAELNRLRKRLWSVEKGLVPVPDPERELAELHVRYHELGDEFVETFRRWQRQASEEAGG